MKIDTLLFAALTAALVTVPGIAPAQTAPAAPNATPASAPVAPSDGEIRKIDMAQGKVTLRHGPLANLDMPGMTMVFKVADPKLLDGLKEGDKVTFTAERPGGAITVTSMQPVR